MPIIQMQLHHGSGNGADNTNEPCKPQLFQHVNLKLPVSQLPVHTYQCCLDNPGHPMQ